jgi:hypothetical protein
MQIKCEERYREALDHAEKTGDNSLQECLNRLESKETVYNGEVILTRDFAPLSFGFEIRDAGGKRLINGGLLYHGKPDQSLAVTFDPSTGWQIHT